ncbi:MAG: hypothetical protein C1941_04760 [Prosthecochloris sp.]|nr:hypothetical protein [Prosthecochloris sp.]
MSGENRGRRIQVNHRTIIVIHWMTSKLKLDVPSGSVWRKPVYWPGGVRCRDGVIPVRALALNCGNLRWRCKGKGTSVKSEAESTEASSRGGAIRSSDEGLVMRVERRDCGIRSNRRANCASRKSFPE